jgi:hypothetical protein
VDSIHFNFRQASDKVLHNDLLNKLSKMMFCIYDIATEVDDEISPEVLVNLLAMTFSKIFNCFPASDFWQQ